MRSSASLALLSASTLVLAFAGGGVATTAKAQSAPVQQAQTPQQADQARESDRSRAKDVKLGQDWRAHDQGNAKHAAGAETTKEHQTVGSNWRVHRDSQKH
jgi:Ni/Co efflux regulator RcnB